MKTQPQKMFTTKANLVVTVCVTSFALLCAVFLAGGTPGSNLPSNSGANVLGLLVSLAYLPYVVLFRKNMRRSHPPGSSSNGFRILNLLISLVGVPLNGVLALVNAYAVLGSFALGS